MDCLNSLAVQSFHNWEAIIINDGSTDDTQKIAEEFCAKDSRFCLVNQPNGGLSAARNAGIIKATGNRLIFLDADDFFYPDCLQTVAQQSVGAGDHFLIQYGYSYINEEGTEILRNVIPNNISSLLPKVLTAVPGPCHTICISKKLIETIGYFDESLNSLEDWDYWIRAAKAGAELKIIPKPLAYYRYVKNSMSRNAFVMFKAFKQVTLRAGKKDERITIDIPSNKEYDVQTEMMLKKMLIRILGVSIMQGKVMESVRFFKEETPILLEKYDPIEFEEMCSYLSFRYWYNDSEIKEVLGSIRFHFELFFDALGIDKSYKNKALFNIFKRHIYRDNMNRYGRILGGAMNFGVRKKFSV